MKELTQKAIRRRGRPPKHNPDLVCSGWEAYCLRSCAEGRKPSQIEYADEIGVTTRHLRRLLVSSVTADKKQVSSEPEFISDIDSQVPADSSQDIIRSFKAEVEKACRGHGEYSDPTLSVRALVVRLVTQFRAGGLSPKDIYNLVLEVTCFGKPFSTLPQDYADKAIRIAIQAELTFRRCGL